MEITLNGDKHQIPESTTVAQLLERFHLPHIRVAVERNREIIPKKLFPTTPLAPHDQIEIVTFVGGG